MALSLLMFNYVYTELSYDTFHEHRNSIYRINLADESVGNNEGISAVTTAAIGPSLIEDFPEVDNMVRFSSRKSGFFTWQERNYDQTGLVYADSSLFKVFSFKLLTGNSKTALVEPFSIVLTESTAQKIFGQTDIAGQIIRYNNEYDYKVTGVVEDPPGNSQLKFNALFSFSTLYSLPDTYLDWNGGHDYYTYIKLNQNASIEDLNRKLPAFTNKHINERVGTEWILYPEPLLNIHLHSDTYADLPTKGSLSKIYNFSLLSVFILLIACINFINLSTAQSIKRAREVGLRKVVGATKKQLISQFLGESLLLSAISLTFSFVLIELFEPAFNQILGTNFHFFAQADFILVAIMILVPAFTGFAAGSIPAFYISRFQPAISIKGINIKKGKPVLRNALVVFQFLISTVIIVSTLVIYSQIQFMQGKGLGFNKDNVVVVELTSELAMKNVDLLKNSFQNITGVEAVAASTSFPGRGLTRNGYLPEGNEQWKMCHVMDVDCEYLPLMNIKVISGRNFLDGYAGDETSYIINETLAKQLGWQDAIGKTIFRGGDHKVIGVVEDFHFSSLHHKIEPLIITNKPWDYYYLLSVKVHPESTTGIVESLESKWKENIPSDPFEYTFLAPEIERNYMDESKTGMAFVYLSIISIIIASLGLFAQAAYNVEQKKKEIGIRKVAGASLQNILVTITGNFAKIVVVANVIGWPVAWYIMNNWLSQFAFHINVQWWIFGIVLLLSLLITSATVFSNAWKAATNNPVEALKYE